MVITIKSVFRTRYTEDDFIMIKDPTESGESGICRGF